MVFAEAGDIGDLVDGVGVEGGKTVSVILLVYLLRVFDAGCGDSVQSTE